MTDCAMFNRKFVVLPAYCSTSSQHCYGCLVSAIAGFVIRTLAGCFISLWAFAHYCMSVEGVGRNTIFLAVDSLAGATFLFELT
jgi:hypothetical protein